MKETMRMRKKLSPAPTPMMALPPYHASTYRRRPLRNRFKLVKLAKRAKPGLESPQAAALAASIADKLPSPGANEGAESAWPIPKV
jgi:hypothetical protein